MKIKVSKTFCSYINKVAKETGKRFSARFIAVSEAQYNLRCGNIFDAYDYGDYNFENNTASVIAVNYPPEFYACDRLLTTKELTQEFRRRQVTTEPELRRMIVDMLEI